MFQRMKALEEESGAFGDTIFGRAPRERERGGWEGATKPFLTVQDGPMVKAKGSPSNLFDR